MRLSSLAQLSLPSFYFLLFLPPSPAMFFFSLLVFLTKPKKKRCTHTHILRSFLSLYIVVACADLHAVHRLALALEARRKGKHQLQNRWGKGKKLAGLRRQTLQSLLREKKRERKKPEEKTTIVRRQSGRSSAASSLSSNKFLLASFLRMAVFGLSSTISAVNWST